MKKIVGIALVSFMALVIAPVNAQISFGVKGGVNISSVHFNGDFLSPNNITGVNIGPMLEVMVPYVGVGVDAAILYSQKGMENLDADYIEIPVNFKWKFGLPIIKGYFAAGPYAGFKIDGSQILSIPGKISSELKTKSFAAGVNAGLGVEVFRRIQVGFNYGLGLTNNYSGLYVTGKSIEGKHRRWTVSAAVLF
jgi:hypothetical protein